MLLSGQGVEPGLYVLVRAGTPAAMRSHLVQGASKSAEGGGGGEWVRPAGCPDDLPLFRVLSADTRQVAQALACNQEIAAEGAFAVAMVAELPAGEHEHFAHGCPRCALTRYPRCVPVLESEGGFGWRRTHWESGMVGQILYLESQEAGLRGTGIGCFFDQVLLPSCCSCGVAYCRPCSCRL